MKIIILSLTLTATILSCALFRGRPPDSSPVPLDFDLEELLIDVSALPSGWQAGEVSSYGTDDIYLDLGQQEDRYIRFTKEDSGFVADHKVYLYPNKASGEYWYPDNLSRQFHNAYRITPWETPSELNYQSPIADQFQIACSIYQHPTENSKQFTQCVMVSQYGRVISAFFTFISPETMGYADLEQVLKAIDQRMATYLKPQ